MLEAGVVKADEVQIGYRRQSQGSTSGDGLHANRKDPGRTGFITSQHDKKLCLSSPKTKHHAVDVNIIHPDSVDRCEASVPCCYRRTCRSFLR